MKLMKEGMKLLKEGTNGMKGKVAVNKDKQDGKKETE